MRPRWPTAWQREQDVHLTRRPGSEEVCKAREAPGPTLPVSTQEVEIRTQTQGASTGGPGSRCHHLCAPGTAAACSLARSVATVTAREASQALSVGKRNSTATHTSISSLGREPTSAWKSPGPTALLCGPVDGPPEAGEAPGQGAALPLPQPVQSPPIPQNPSSQPRDRPQLQRDHQAVLPPSLPTASPERSGLAVMSTVGTLGPREGQAFRPLWGHLDTYGDRTGLRRRSASSPTP